MNKKRLIISLFVLFVVGGIFFPVVTYLDSIPNCYILHCNVLDYGRSCDLSMDFVDCTGINRRRRVSCIPIPSPIFLRVNCATVFCDCILNAYNIQTRFRHF